MSVAYKIAFTVPDGYDPSRLLRGLPSPISRPKMEEIYNYSVLCDGFYFIDRLVDAGTSALAFRQFMDEALAVSGSVQVIYTQPIQQGE